MRRMWGTLTLIVVLGALAGSVYAVETADLTSYDIRVTLDPSAQTLVGSQEVEYVNDTGETLNEVVFCLIGNWSAEPNPHLHPALIDPQYVAGFDPTWTKIHGVTDGAGAPLAYHFRRLEPLMQTYSLDDGLLIAELPAPLASGDRTTVRIEFETRFARALALDNCVYRGTFVWRFGWNPIAVPPSTAVGSFILPAADYRVELTVPEDHRVFGGADRQTELETIAGLTRYTLENDRPARSVPLVIGPDLDSVSSVWDGVEVEAVHLPGGETFARLSLSYIAEILSWFSERFGPLGYGRLVLVEAPTPGLYGMAADGMILVGQSAVALKDMPALGAYDRLIEYLLAHEAAHLWWGIGIGTDFNAENWISEGFAEYLSIGYFEEKYGGFESNLLTHLGSGLIEDILLEQYGYLNLRQHLSEAPYVDLLRLDFDEAIVKPLAEVEYLNGQTVRTYNKGYLVLRALESVIGQESLRTALVEANQRWRSEVLSVDAFQRLAEDASGVDLSAFFADWLRGDERLDIAVDRFESVESKDVYTTTIHLRREGRGLPVEVRVTFADGSTVDRLWHAGAAEGTIVLESLSPVLRVHVDPEEMLPDANRFNNHSPRRILVDHPFRFEDDPGTGRPLDAYVISISPTNISGSFRNDHRWSLVVTPHVDEDETYDDLNDVFARWDLIGLFAADVDRWLSLSTVAMVTGLDPADGSGKLDAWFTIHTRGFTHPEIGTAGRYWYPTHQFDLTLGARGDLTRPIPFVAVTFARSDLLASFMVNSVTLRAGIPGFSETSFATAEWAGLKRFRFAHLLYLDLSASAGAALLESLPTEFMFSLDRLHAFALPPYGHYQIYGRGELVLPPLARNVGYAIFNLTRLVDMIVSAYLQGGRTWGGCEQVCESGIRAEAGAKLTLRFDGFLGTSIVLSVGYAHPLYGLDGEAAPFFEFAAPF